jgi:ABC-type transporter Mla subunit MlaD
MRSVAARFLAPVLFLAGLVTGSVLNVPAALAQTYQPRMMNALHALYTAQNELNAASADKGGYRQRALNDVADAIHNVHLGIRYANANNR